MSDVGTTPEGADAPLDPSSEAAAPQPASPAPVRGPSMFDDPVVRAMAIASVALVVLGLATVLGVLFTGVTEVSGPRTVAEKNVLVGRAAVSAGSTDTAVWGGYIASLIEAGQYSNARRLIDDARASFSESSTAEFTLAEARLAAAQGDHEAAVELADKTQEILNADLKQRIDKGGTEGARAKNAGPHENYYAATLIAAYSLQELGRWDEAIKRFDVYIGKTRGAADILIDRGNAKVETGDEKGAEKDFREALRFMPGNPEALEGLERIGVEE